MQWDHQQYRLKLEIQYREIRQIINQFAADNYKGSKLYTQAWQKQRRIAAALARLQDGSYGVCLACGCEIAAERLDMLPHAEYCLACQRQQEL